MESKGARAIQSEVENKIDKMEAKGNRVRDWWIVREVINALVQLKRLFRNT